MQLLLIAGCVVVLAIHMSEGLGFGGGAAASCGCAPPPPPPCPPPPPPPVCAPPPPPVCAPPPVQNQCCAGPPPPQFAPPQGPQCGCRTRRRFIKRRVTRDTTHEVTQISDSTEDDPRCNSKELRDIILNHVSNDADASKLAIHNAANTRLGGHYAVICSSDDFTYVADSRVYCVDGNAHVTCYAFQI